MKRRILWLGLSCLMVAAMLLASCSNVTQTTATITATTTAIITTTTSATTALTTSETNMVKDFMGRLVEAPKYGGTFRPVFATDPASTDPGDGASLSVYVFNLVFEKLGIGDWTAAGAGTGEQLYLHGSYFDFAKYGKPNLAESWEMTDPLTLTVHIRQGVHFQNKAPVNGRELVAEDVRYCFQRYFDNTVAPADFRAYLASITTTDKWTVVFKWKQPYCKAVEDIVFGRVYIYAPELVTTYGNLSNWKNLVGTGPFAMTDFVQGGVETFVANPNYWATDEIIPGNKLPYLGRVQGIVFSDPAAIMAALRTGKTDWVFNINDEQAQTIISSAPQLKYQACPKMEANPLVVLRVTETPLNDIRIRQALMLAIDFNGIIKDYFHGDAVPLTFPIMKQWANYYTALEDMPADIQELYSYNVTKAKALMTAAGYPTGFNVDFLIFPSTATQCQMLMGYWKELGITFNVSTPDAATAVAKLWTKNFHGIGTVTAGITGPITCLTWSTSTHTYDWESYNNPAYDALIAKLLATTDPDEQATLVKQAVIMVYRDIPYFTFPGGYGYNFWQPWVKNYHGEICLGGVMGYNTWTSRIWVDDSLKKSMGY